MRGWVGVGSGRKKKKRDDSMRKAALLICKRAGSKHTEDRGRAPRKGTTDQRGFARVVNVEEVTVQVQVLVLAHLYRGVRHILRDGARREGQLRKCSEGRQRDFRNALRGEGGFVDNDL